eukprot:1177356-Prorocentrum_minimum.AAC.1
MFIRVLPSSEQAAVLADAATGLLDGRVQCLRGLLPPLLRPQPVVQVAQLQHRRHLAGPGGAGGARDGESSVVRYGEEGQGIRTVVYAFVPPPISPRPGYILLSLLRLVPVRGIVERGNRAAERGDHTSAYERGSRTSE